MNLLLFVVEHPFLEPAVKLARSLAKQSDSRLTLLFARWEEKGQQRAQTALKEAQAILGDQKIDAKVATGKPVELLFDEIETGRYDMLVVGASKRLGFLKKVADSVDSRVLKEPAIPVMVVTEERPEIKRMLICTGGQEISEPVVKAGADLAEVLGAEATLLHVGSNMPSMYSGLDEMEETTEELLDTDTPLARNLRRGAEILADHEVPAELDVEHGIVAEEILRESEEGDYDLIVMGASGARVNFLGWLQGDVTSEVIDRSPAPVLIVGH
ncbi:MAG: universal stress protein [Chloroflexi bacterium]|nr:MAG: universal stress protein [Chloroflexota bacterium]MBL1194768.1 universal stress protein [Chloroflexota bacterium]NOH12060.1 universal stress protein [Chloroflexota bacterium]